MRTMVLAIAALVAACSTADVVAPTPTNAEGPPVAPAPAAAPGPQPPSACGGTSCDPVPVPAPPAPLRVRFLGVGGFLVEAGDQAVLTAPLFTRPDMVTVTTGIPVTSDAALVEASLPAASLADVRAILAGHAHYDHLLDVPSVLGRAPQAMLYSNTSARLLLDAYAPDRAPACTTEPAVSPTISRSRVVALDDAASSVVDYTNCPDKRPVGAPLTGKWVDVPGAHVRLYAVCSEHPDQIGPLHFAPGAVDAEQCTPPTRADAWKEGPTLAFLVDFLDAATGAPIYRVYYQDAPTNAPVGHVPPAVLAGKRVDVALLCVGSSDHVVDAPQTTIAALATRYALGGHWEDFLRPASEPPQPIPFLDVGAWADRARAALPPADEPKHMLHNGAVEPERAVLPNPGDVFEIVP